MAFDPLSALGGAAQGASIGAKFGVPGAVIGGLAGVAGGLLGRKKRRGPDISQLVNTINQSRQRQRELISGLRPQLSPLSTRFKSDAGTLGQGYIQNAGDTSGALSNAAFQQGRQQLLEDQPTLSQNLRESLAQSGIGRGGALLAAKAKQNQELGRSLGNLSSNVNIENLRNKQDAIKQVFGFDQDVMEKLFSSGRQDLIDEMSNLLDEERNSTSSLLNVQGAQSTNTAAEGLAANNQRQGLLNTILSGLGSTAGTLLKKK